MRLRAAVVAVCLIGIGVAAYLTAVHYAHTAPICTTGGCEKVQTSRYAELGGVPVALLGLVAYVVLLALSLVRGAPGPIAAALAAVVSLVAVAFSGYLLWAQIARIHAICQWCVGNDAIAAVLAVLCTVRALTEHPAGRQGE